MSKGDWFRKLSMQGQKVPAGAIDLPRLSAHEVPFWEAFNFLHASRTQTAMGPGSIPLSEMMTYADLMQIAIGEDRELFVQILRTMDMAYLKWAQEPHG